MQNSREPGNQIAMVGAIVFLLLFASLGLWLYAEELSRTNTAAVMLCATIAKKTAVLIACATIGAFILSTGRFWNRRRRKEISGMRIKDVTELKRVGRLSL